MDSPGSEVDSGSAPVEWTGPAISLDDCDAQARTFEELAGESGLLVAIGAAWCGPCQDDAPALQAFGVAHPDVGVAQVLVQDTDGAPATSLVCDAWTETYALTHPVLIDPVFVTEPIAGDQGFPVHLVYSAAGEQLYAEPGAFDEAGVTAALAGGEP